MNHPSGPALQGACSPVSLRYLGLFYYYLNFSFGRIKVRSINPHPTRRWLATTTNALGLRIVENYSCGRRAIRRCRTRGNKELGLLNHKEPGLGPDPAACRYHQIRPWTQSCRLPSCTPGSWQWGQGRLRSRCSCRGSGRA